MKDSGKERRRSPTRVEIMASFPLDYTVSKIVSLLEKEVSLLGGIRHELNEIKDEFVSMTSFLQDAANEGAGMEGQKAWVKNVRDIAYDVEDIIDEITYHVNRPQSDGKLIRLLQKTIRAPQNLWMRHYLRGKLSGINQRIKAISERRHRYGVSHIGTSSHNEQKRIRCHGESSLFISKDKLVGIEEDKDFMVQWLTDGEPRQSIISIVGMGGSGKTSLVSQVYNDPLVKTHFDSYAWISVSQNYMIEDLLKSMLTEFYQAMGELKPKDLSSMNYRQLVEKLVNFLKPIRFVIVFDDVWNINFWSEIQVSLPDGNCGSRILLTTRKEDIASSPFGVRNLVHYIQPLGRSESWILFCMKAFSGNPDKCCPPELEAVARDLLEKCKGLPLAIVALGGLLASKKVEVEWRKVYKALNWELTNNPMLEVVKSVLLLSFYDLPHQLKQCFLYCSLFPEDHLIRRKRLIRLWMAEGFVEEIRGLTPEEVAGNYLLELGHRNMVQLLGNTVGKPKACKMHDLMLEVALSISDQQNFCKVYKCQERVGERRVRRMSIQSCDERLASWEKMPQLRSLCVFASHSLTSLYSIPTGFRLLRVLELEYVPIRALPRSIGNLFNLRYLNLTGTYIEELPRSIGRLCNLQTLNLLQTKIKAFPSGILKLHNLRYLIASYYDLELVDDFEYVGTAKVPSGITKLKNLQVLHFVEVNGQMSRHLYNLNQLTCLGILKSRGADEKALCSSIENMHLLSHLSIKVSKEDEVLHVDSMSSPPPHLGRVSLIGKLDKIPGWLSSLQNLKALFLSWSRLNEDPLPYIQSLPNLRRLSLVNAYSGKGLHFLAGFQTLQSLVLRNLPQLEEIIVEKGVMPGIQNLWHSKCMELKMLPQGVEHLTSLQQLCLANVSDELVERIRGEDGVDRARVKHIPKINHYYQTSTGWFYENLS